MNKLKKEIEKHSVIQEFKGHKNITIEDKNLYRIVSDVVDEILTSLGEDDNIEEWKAGVRSKIMKDSTK